MNTELISWLKDTKSNTCIIKYGRSVFCFMKVRANADFDYLYFQGPSSCDVEPSHMRDLVYTGIFCRKTGKLYDAKCIVRNIAGQEEELQSSQLQETLQMNVRQLVENVIANDRCNLRVTELSDPTLLRALKNNTEYIRWAARERFLNNEDFTPPSFQCEYKAKKWTDAALFAYISDPQSYTAREAESYMKTCQEEMLFSFLCNDLELAEYQALISDTTNPLHIIKKIRKAMSDSPDVKWVTVTILKDGEEFCFVTRAWELEDDDLSIYSEHWDTTKARRDQFVARYGSEAYPEEQWDDLCCYYDRRDMRPEDSEKFDARYGHDEVYLPREIVRITDGEKVLYEAGK